MKWLCMCWWGLLCATVVWCLGCWSVMVFVFGGLGCGLLVCVCVSFAPLSTKKSGRICRNAKEVGAALLPPRLICAPPLRCKCNPLPAKRFPCTLKLPVELPLALSVERSVELSDDPWPLALSVELSIELSATLSENCPSLVKTQDNAKDS